MAKDMVTMTDDELAVYASRAFRIGLAHGRKHAKPITANQLAYLLELPARRIVHTRKIRQVYGAGFDIGTINSKVASSPLT